MFDPLEQSSWIVIAATAFFLIYLHNFHVLYFCVGSLVATGSAKVLKILIGAPRPAAPGTRPIRPSHGMPSTHSTATSFFATYIILCLFNRPLDAKVPYIFGMAVNEDTTYLLAINVFLGVSVMAYSRVLLGHHTPAQVLVGMVLGSLWGLLWYAMWVGIFPSAVAETFVVVQGQALHTLSSHLKKYDLPPMVLRLMDSLKQPTWPHSGFQTYAVPVDAFFKKIVDNVQSLKDVKPVFEKLIKDEL